MITLSKFLNSAKKRLQSLQYKVWDIQAFIQKNGMHAYWWNGHFNFGDLITPVLLQHYHHTPLFSRPQKASMAAVGSILGELPEDFAGVILGSGFYWERSTQTFPKATVLAVRGKLTREKLGRGDDVALGDPGLLASMLMPERKRKKYRLGVIPHYIDQDEEHFKGLKKTIRGDVQFIDVRKDPRAVFYAIDECENIISSSLHGLIVADSLGIPNAWVGSKKLPDGRFKYDDYYSAFDFTADPITVKGDESLEALIEQCTLKPQDKISRIKVTLHGIWRSLLDRNIE
jgi:pyruvyltransferase